MKLSEIVDYLNLMSQDHVSPDYEIAMKKFENMVYMVSNHTVQIQSINEELTKHVESVYHAFDQVNQTMDELKNILIDMVEAEEPQLLAQSSNLYQEEMRHELNEYILTRRLTVDEDSNLLIRAHLKNYTDWRLPGMIIRPGRDTFIQDLVPMDPLYMVDQNIELLSPALNEFNEQYQRRLRLYGVEDYKHDSPLWQLPDNQFGLVFAWNYFNFKPMEVFKRYLQDIYAKLRPGGVTMFTYNNCDYGHAVALAESNFMCYTPGRLVKSYAESLGFEIIFEHRGHGNLHWLELRKPGEIESIRGGQSLAKIIATE
jgi:hypothetical protein